MQKLACDSLGTYMRSSAKFRENLNLWQFKVLAPIESANATLLAISSNFGRIFVPFSRYWCI